MKIHSATCSCIIELHYYKRSSNTFADFFQTGIFRGVFFRYQEYRRKNQRSCIERRARSAPVLCADELKRTGAHVAQGVAQPIPTSEKIFSKIFVGSRAFPRFLHEAALRPNIVLIWAKKFLNFNQYVLYCSDVGSYECRARSGEQEVSALTQVNSVPTDLAPSCSGADR